MGRRHSYTVTVTWTGNQGTGTSGYRDYQRSHEISAAGKSGIAGSSDPAFRGDRACWNPEDLLVASLSACHELWFEAYVDEAVGVMEEAADGGGQFVEVVLRPRVRVASGSDQDKIQSLHHEAHAKCFIARSVNFPVRCEPVID
jgi:organic hydroperoxide reductase OsmC/OhrA